MSITPWSWERSNGSATEQQTKKAHNALLTNMNTSLFSRFVWNDIVQKAYALCLELGSTWNSHYLSKSDTSMDEPYSALTAKMFNSLRLNTHYPSWTWNYDTTTPGYIGRTDFKGMAEVGATLSDTVYGYYIVEITERLNKIIGILNGTEPYYDLVSNGQSILTPTSNLIILPGESTCADGIIIQSANAEIKNLSPASLLNKFSINGPIMRAVMESEPFSNYFARVRMNLLFTRAIQQLPSVLFSVSPIMTLSGIVDMDTIPPVPLITHGQSEITHTSYMSNLPSTGIMMSGKFPLIHEAAGVKLPSAAINNTYLNSVIIPQGLVELSRLNDGRAPVTMRGISFGKMRTSPCLGIISGGSVVLSDSLYIDAVSPLSLITHGQSEIIHTAYSHKLPSAGIMVSGISTLFHEAVGVKLPSAAINNTYLNSAIIPQGLVETTKIKGGRAPVTMWGSSFGALRTSPHLGIISGGSAVLSDSVHGEIIPVLSVLSHGQSEVTHGAYIHKLPTVNISSSVTASQSNEAIGTRVPSAAINSTNVNSAVQPQGNMDKSKIKGGRAAAVINELPHGTLRTSPCSSIMSEDPHNLLISASLHQTDEFNSANATLYSDIQPLANLGKLENMVPLSANVDNSLYPSAIPNMRQYIHARTSVNMTLSYHTLLQLDTTWEYPLHMGDDLSISQLWQTEENTPYLFWDFDRFRVTTTDTVGFATHGLTLLPLPFGASDGFVITSTPVMQAYNTLLWEHPIKTDNDLYIKQSEQNKIKKHRLEVK